MDDALREQVRRRARKRCEYCLLPEGPHPIPFELEHIISRQHGGATVFGNLAWACLHCNLHKGPNIAGRERRQGRTLLVPLFNPRRHKWERHFRWQGAYVAGRTPIGRVTVALLAMNDAIRVQLRQTLIAEGRFPPR